MLSLILNQFLEHWPQFSIYLLLVLLVALTNSKATQFYIASQKTNKEFPAIAELLQKIHNAIHTLNMVLLEKNVISKSQSPSGKNE